MSISDIHFSVDLAPGERLNLPREIVDSIGPGRWEVRISPVGLGAEPPRGHSAFLNSYGPEDEGLYDDVTAAR